MGSPGYGMLHVSEVSAQFRKNSGNNVKMKDHKKGEEGQGERSTSALF